MARGEDRGGWAYPAGVTSVCVVMGLKRSPSGVCLLVYPLVWIGRWEGVVCGTGFGKAR